MIAKRSILIAVAVLGVAVLGLTGCGSDSSDTSNADGTERLAAFKTVDLCVGDRAWDRIVGATVTYDGQKINGAGPFPLEGNWCDTSDVDFVTGSIRLADGSLLAKVQAGDIFGQRVNFDCRSKGWGSPKSLAPGEQTTYSCEQWQFDVIREPDSGGLKHFQVWVRRA